MTKEINDTHPYRRTLLRAVGMTKKFGALVAVNGVDFDVPRHGIVSMIGPNGAGKTVFFNMLTGLVKPDSGEVWFNGSVLRASLPTALHVWYSAHLPGHTPLQEDERVRERAGRPAYTHVSRYAGCRASQP